MEKEYSDKTLKLFALSSNEPLAQAVADEVGTHLCDVSIMRFADGEIKINIEESVRGDHVYVLQSTSDPVNDNIIELLIMIDALKRASADTIEVIIPYYGYSRADRKATPREPITAKLFANLVTIAGADRVIALDLHAEQLQGFFKIPVDTVSAVRLFASYFNDHVACEVGIDKEDWVVVAPDYSSTGRARQLASLLNVSLAIVDEREDEQISGVVGNVRDKYCILFDDIIDTANTITTASENLAKHGAKRIVAAATHPVLSGDAVDKINNSEIVKVVVTDSIQIPEEKQSDKIKTISVASLLAQAILTVHELGSMTELRAKKNIPYEN